MSVVPIRWRPLGPRDLDAGRARLMEAIGPWQEQWFAHPFVRVESVSLIKPADGFVVPATASTWKCGTDVWLCASARSASDIVNGALDLPKSFTPVGEPAIGVLADFQAKLIDSLFAVIRDALMLPVTEDFAPVSVRDAVIPLCVPRGAAHFRVVTNDGEDLLSIICGAETLWRWLPVAVNARPATPQQLESRAVAIESSRLRIAATLGQCELTAAQLATLAVGDVIALDHPIGDAVPLILTSRDCTRSTLIAMGKPGQRAGKFSIQLTSIPEADNL
ncbi:FliM/FliN family flagellar motor C-terminal domain-containing protein [Paraburkholderia sp. GAS82]|uniref:FliM/FliN family flagellar motor switch protein n=1 Tax=Paraburkholderia sp. GAS82 TaxID=3035137 RepID=UPI003D1905E1